MRIINILLVIVMACVLSGCGNKMCKKPCKAKKPCAAAKVCEKKCEVKKECMKKPCCAKGQPCPKHKTCTKAAAMKPECPLKAAAEANQPAAEPAKTEAPAAQVPTAEEKPAAEPAKSQGKLIVLTNEANYELDKDIINFISTRGVTVENVRPADFDKIKNEKYILILGGPNDGDGLGGIVKQLLTEQEAGFVSQTGNKELYLKPDKFSPGQQMIVIAGYDPEATFRQFVNSKDKWWGYISSWFNIELSHDEVYGY